MATRILAEKGFLCFISACTCMPIFYSRTMRYFSTDNNSKFPFYSGCSVPDQLREEVSLVKLLQRYGFSSSQSQDLPAKNQFILNSNMQELEESLVVLSSFRIPQKYLISLICNCPGVLELQYLKKWEMCFPRLGSLITSPLIVKNVLEHSRKLHLNPDEFLISVENLRSLGLSNVAIGQVLQEFPSVVLMKNREVHSMVDFLTEAGISLDDIDRFFCLFPNVLGLGVERLKHLLHEFQDLGFSNEQVRKEVVREPRFLAMELGEFSRCLLLIKSLKCREVIKKKILSLGELRAGFEVKQRVDCLCSHGLIRREALNILWKEPRLILYEIEEMEKKINFLVCQMKFNIDCLPEVPEYLGVNFEKQIVPRYNVVKHLRAKGAIGFEVGLKDLIKLSRNRFYNLYVKPYPECEEIFQRFSPSVEVKTQNPAGLWKLFKPQKSVKTQDVRNMKSFMDTPV